MGRVCASVPFALRLRCSASAPGAPQQQHTAAASTPQPPTPPTGRRAGGAGYGIAVPCGYAALLFSVRTAIAEEEQTPLSEAPAEWTPLSGPC